MNREEKIFISSKEAISILLDGEDIHTFRNSSFMLIGCDWRRQDILDLLKEHDGNIEIGGEQCQRMGHGLVVYTSPADPLFIECDKEKLKELEEKHFVK